jgi:hypothetical protein
MIILRVCLWAAKSRKGAKIGEAENQRSRKAGKSREAGGQRSRKGKKHKTQKSRKAGKQRKAEKSRKEKRRSGEAGKSRKAETLGTRNQKTIPNREKNNFLKITLLKLSAIQQPKPTDVNPRDWQS